MNTWRQRLGLAAALTLAAGTLSGCTTPSVPFLRQETLSTANFQILVPHGMQAAEGAGSWEVSLDDRSGYTFWLDDVDDAGAPKQFMAYDGEGGENGWELGLAGCLAYCGYVRESADHPGTVEMNYAAGCEGRVLHIRMDVPKSKQKRAKRQLQRMMETIEYCGQPLGAGVIEAPSFTLHYSQDWTPELSAEQPDYVGLHDSLADTDALGAVAVSVEVLADETRTPKELAKEKTERTMETSFSRLYRSIKAEQKRRLGYVTWSAILCYDGGDEDADAVVTEHCYAELEGRIFHIVLTYTQQTEDSFFRRLAGVTLDVPETAAAPDEAAGTEDTPAETTAG